MLIIVLLAACGNVNESDEQGEAMDEDHENTNESEEVNNVPNEDQEKIYIVLAKAHEDQREHPDVQREV